MHDLLVMLKNMVVIGIFTYPNFSNIVSADIRPLTPFVAILFSLTCLLQLMHCEIVTHYFDSYYSFQAGFQAEILNSCLVQKVVLVYKISVKSEFYS